MRRAHRLLGDVFVSLARLDAALEYEAARNVFLKLVEDRPAHLIWQQELGVVYRRIGALLNDRADQGEYALALGARPGV